MDHIAGKELQINDLKQIDTQGGPIYHVLKSSDTFFNGFGEAYFSTIEGGFVKAWKMHTKMTCNLVVPCGRVKFVVFEKDPENNNFNLKLEAELSPLNYKLLTIPPGYIFGFQGLSEDLNLVLNVSDVVHSPEESLKIDKDEIAYEW